ncbi:hypothetical protein QN277_015098 [Acacia crassicarpa]|uniref:BURP domain-containing protein n=1 Tax=Acacia crassicarpa TaxID=499986 RepID=A0AAE1JXM0_9FABA|nr:hypothetical protein QN277_015098 [Acacia crassicarpa]KAK4277035.1 hypothetical protein QN277_015098 [Acacia crassicarpa]KAK4277036.1 hypothetical protein QN277_015098 [Acacia crassicarpa]
MQLYLLPLFALLSIELVASHAALPPQLYWQSLLPSTPIPSSLSHLLLPSSADWREDKGGVDARNFRYGYPPKHADWREDKGGVDARNFRYKYPPKHSDWREDKGGVNARNFRYRYPPQTQLHDGVNARPFHYRYPPQTQRLFGYLRYNATENQLHDGPNVALFFLEKDIKAGHKMKLHFTQSSNQASFLPRELANSIPFSSAKLNDILNRFDIKPESEDAEVIKNTVKDCEEEGIKGEEIFCATSLESMVDFTTSKLGNEVDALSTEAVKDTPMQEYTIAPGVKEVGVDEAVVCHRQEYPFAVFYCHKTEGTRAYRVPLEGADGVRVKAVAVCHIDTSEWNPEHLAFQVLKVKPGTVPVCHFLPQDHVVWVPKYLRSLTGSS